MISYNEHVAPHILAEKYKVPICISDLIKFINNKSKHKSISLIEGAGGLLTPYSNNTSQMDLICKLQCSVLVIVNIKTGCINHAILTMNELERNGVKSVKWVANSYTDSSYIDEQILTIEKFSQKKCLLKVQKNDSYLSFIELSKILMSPDENI